MRQVLSVSKTRTLPSWRQWKQLPSVLSLAEKRTLMGAASVILLSLCVIAATYLSAHRIEIPAVGGDYTEGLVGEPQFINPLYASTNDVDQDLTRLVYSGLLKWDGEASFVPDLAESIDVTEEGTVYTLKIRDNARFHNGEDVRARDILFTINAIQTPSYRSPLAANFQGVSVVQEDDKTISFILDEPFAPFLQHLTVGILPASLWADVLPQNVPLAALNLQPIGTGPYKFLEFTKDKKGAVRSYTLERNEDYYLEPALIETLTFKFYGDAFALADALENKNVEGASVIAYDQLAQIKENKNVQLISSQLPRETNLYFNEVISPALSDLAVRSAISQAINKLSLVEALEEGYAEMIHAPILEGMIGYHAELTDSYDPEQAASSLEEAGYRANIVTGMRELKSGLVETTEESTDEETEEATAEEDDSTETVDEEPGLSFTLTAVDSQEMRLAAEQIKQNLVDVGINIELAFTPAELMLSEVIEPQNFEILLTSVMLQADPDPYPFWHSSQGSGMGLNLVNYENEDVDTLLEEARVEIDETVREEKYQQFQELLAKDLPAVFLYRSHYSSAVASKITLEPVETILSPADRFTNVTDWYIKTKKALR